MQLDSDDVAESEFEVAIPETPIGQRVQLTDAVRSRYPEAEFRSFANEAASFLAPKFLIVATYRRGPAGDRDMHEGDLQLRLL